MGQETLRAAVEAQARARLERDLATFASYMTPQALVQLHGSSADGGLRGFEVVEVSEDGAFGSSVVAYAGSRPHSLLQRWERNAGSWRAISAERRGLRTTIWRRIFRMPGAGSQPRSEGTT